MIEKIARTAESESKKAMYQARDARNGALVYGTRSNPRPVLP
jgi:hypothetical protein